MAEPSIKIDLNKYKKSEQAEDKVEEQPKPLPKQTREERQYEKESYSKQKTLDRVIEFSYLDLYEKQAAEHRKAME